MLFDSLFLLSTAFAITFCNVKDCYEIEEHIVEQNKQLAQAAIKASEVSPQALISEGFTGKQLGLAIKEKRLETLTHQLKQTL